MKTHARLDEIPTVGLGTWKAAPGEVGAAVREALRLGYRHLDCAAIYVNEREVGEAIARSIADGVLTRDELWVTSKLWNDAHDPADVEAALDRTLADLGLDALDLYLIHWPVAHKKGVPFPRGAADLRSLDEVPLTATWAALERMVDAGKCRHIGVSNFNVRKLTAILESARIRPYNNQIELHPYLQQAELVAYCRDHGVTVTAYSPLGSIDRPAFLKAEGEPILLEDPTLAAIAGDHGVSVAQVALAWAIQRGTIVIPKSIRPDRLAENLAAVAITLSADEMDRIAALDRRRRYLPGDVFAQPGGPYTLEGLWEG